PASGGAPRQAGASCPATVEVPPPADDIWSAAHSRVAQLVEQPAVNRRVAGSSPASGASQLSAPQSLSDGPFGPSGAGDGLVTVSGSLSGVGTAHARSSIATAPSSASSRSCTYSAMRSGSRSPMYWTPSQASPEPRATSPATPRRKPCTARNGRCGTPARSSAFVSASQSACAPYTPGSSRPHFLV